MKTDKDYNYSFNHVNKRLNERYDISPLTISEYKQINEVTEMLRGSWQMLWSDNNGDQEVYKWKMINKKGNYVDVKLVWSVSKQRVTTIL